MLIRPTPGRRVKWVGKNEYLLQMRYVSRPRVGIRPRGAGYASDRSRRASAPPAGNGRCTWLGQSVLTRAGS